MEHDVKNTYKKTLAACITTISGLFILAPSSHAVDLLNAKHKILWPSSVSKKIGNTQYVQGKKFRANVIVDTKNTANIRRDYKLSYSFVHFFEPGVTLRGGIGDAVGQLPASSMGKKLSGNLRFNFDFRPLCGKKGAVTTIVGLKDKRNAYLNLHQGPRPVPTAGGIDPVVVDCERPKVDRIGGQSPESFNHMCLADLTYGRRSTDIQLSLSDDIGIHKVEITSDNPALKISPVQLNRRDLRETSADGRKKYTASFKITASNRKPISNIKLKIKVSDLSGQYKKYVHKISLDGVGINAVDVNLKPIASTISVGEKIFFGGTVNTIDCSLKSTEDVQWTIYKLSSKTNTRGNRVNSGQFRIKSNRTPFIIPFKNNKAGYYQLRMLDVSKNSIIYKSPVINAGTKLINTPIKLKGKTAKDLKFIPKSSKPLQNPNLFKLKQ
jgi:hypothetical protein